MRWPAASPRPGARWNAGHRTTFAYFSLAQALFFQRDVRGVRNAAERLVALNPMDGNSIAFLGELLTYSGDAERGLTQATRAKQLDPHHPGWYWWADLFHACLGRDYTAALECASKIDMPGHLGVAHGIGHHPWPAR